MTRALMRPPVTRQKEKADMNRSIADEVRSILDRIEVGFRETESSESVLVEDYSTRFLAVFDDLKIEPCNLRMDKYTVFYTNENRDAIREELRRAPREMHDLACAGKLEL